MRYAGAVLLAVGCALGVIAGCALGGCAPRADREAREAQLLERARRLTSGLEGAWVKGLQAHGQVLFYGRAGCATCHRIGDIGARYTGPNLGIDPACATNATVLTEKDPVACRPVAERVGVRHSGLGPLEYVVESIMDPDRVVTPTYASKVMKRLDEPPVSLTDDEIIALAAFVAGGECPKTASGIAAARHFLGPCREARDARAN